MKQISRYKYAYFLFVLAPLAFWLVVSCSSAPKHVALTEETVAQWNATVEKTIAEPQRTAKVKELGQQLIDVAKSIQQDVETLDQKAMALNENHGATKAEFQQLLDEFVAKRNPKFDKYRDIIFAMRREVSAEEWKKLMK